MLFCADAINDELENEEIEQTKTHAETDVKCPSCGAAISFDPSIGKLSCEYCGYQKDIAITDEDSAGFAEMDFEEAEHTANQDWGAAKKTVVCKSCGAELVYDALETASVCPYCGSNEVMQETDGSTIAPNGIIAFALSAKQAGEKFMSWVKWKIFAPGKFKKTVKYNKFKGVYLPYWTFDSETTSNFTAQYGKNRTVRRNGKTVTVTDWHSCSGVHQEFIDDQTVCATKRLDESLIRKAEPFNTAFGKPYKPEFVAGFASERYSIGLRDSWEKAKVLMSGRLRSSIESKVRSRYNADSVRAVRMNTDFSKVTFKYMLFPVWMSSFKYKDKVYNFLVNGQTGNVSGKTPVSLLRVCIAVAVLLAVLCFGYACLGYDGGYV